MRNDLNKLIHALGKDIGLDHAQLSERAKQDYGVWSMGALTTAQMGDMASQLRWEANGGKEASRPAGTITEAQKGMIYGIAYDTLGMTTAGLEKIVIRQTSGREDKVSCCTKAEGTKIINLLEKL